MKFISQGLITSDENGNENPIAKMVISILGVVAEMTRIQIILSRPGIDLAKMDPNKYLGRKHGSVQDPIKFLTKKKNKQTLELLKNGYKNIEVAKITGLHVNTITKINRHF